VDLDTPGASGSTMRQVVTGRCAAVGANGASLAWNITDGAVEEVVFIQCAKQTCWIGDFWRPTRLGRSRT
jgi:hypothetical protein